MATEAQDLNSHAAVRASIDLNSEFNVAFVTMNVLATVVDPLLAFLESL